MISLTCNYCRHPWSVGSPLGGRSVWCPQCGTPTDVPVIVKAIGDTSTIDGDHTGSVEAFDFSRFLTPSNDSRSLGELGGYRVVRPIGHGGMGIVFEVEDPILKRRVALKVMRPEVADSAIARKRFLREAEAAAQLNHDNILPIYHIDQDRDVLFLTMPLLQGETLDARLKQNPAMTIPEVLSIGRQIAEGLQAAHEKGLIHRDIKPGNIWLERGSDTVASGGGESADTTASADMMSLLPRVKILDFGLARHANPGTDVTGSGVIVGSPAFMSPEQARGQALGPRADLFSLGCILYLMTTGERPFKGDEVMAVLLAVANDFPKPPRRIRTETPASLSRLIMRLLEKKANHRPASAGEVAKQLSWIERSCLPNLPRYRWKWPVVAGLVVAFLSVVVRLIWCWKN